MNSILSLFSSSSTIYTGTNVEDGGNGRSIDMFQLLCRVVLRYLRTGKIECNVNSLSDFLVELIKTDCAAKWEWFMKRKHTKGYTLPILASLTPIAPLLFRKKSTAWKLAAGLLLAPLSGIVAYATLPREKLSVYRLRSEAREHMEDEQEAVECLTVSVAREIKGRDGEDIVTGSRLVKTTAKAGRHKRKPYAAKVAQVARSKVGYLKNTPENRLIYQRVIIEIMDKDCVRYVDRDFILPLAIGCCFVYPDGVEEAAALWGSQESLGVK